MIKNILFIMADQMRADCWGAGLGLPGAKLDTPALEQLARRGLVFSKAYCPSAICGPSRMAFYTGQFSSTHGSSLNQAPLPVGTLSMPDRMRALGLRAGLVGKTHLRADKKGLKRLGLEKDQLEGLLASEGGFEPFARDDGLHPMPRAGVTAYNTYLRSLGYDGQNPWHDHANSAEGQDGALLSGWLMRNADKPARIPAEHSETAWATDEAMRFIAEQGDAPWFLHLSYIKPHWPYMAPAPYHALYGEQDVWPAVQMPEAPHPVHQAFLAHPESISFQDETVRSRVIPAYLGMIKEVDDHIGRLMAWLEKQGYLDDTLIVFTSDHGDYLGDHGLGEKQLFHDVSAQIPLILSHPSLGQGSTVDIPVEGVDLLPTFLDALGADTDPMGLHGRSLLQDQKNRPPALVECDFSNRHARSTLGLSARDARGWMLTDGRWKYIYWKGAPEQLYDLQNDLEERSDLAGDPGHQDVCAKFKDHLFNRFSDLMTRCTMTEAEIDAELADYDLGGRIKIGVW